MYLSCSPNGRDDELCFFQFGGESVREITLFLAASPYSGQTTASALKFGNATLALGHRVSIFATADGVYTFLQGQKPTGVFRVNEAVGEFLSKGGRVHL